MTRDKAKLGEIWLWWSKESSQEEYWLITRLPDTALCIWGGSLGAQEEITVNDSYFTSRWKKVT